MASLRSIRPTLFVTHHSSKPGRISLVSRVTSPLDKLLCILNVVRTSDDQRRPLMQLFGLHVEDAQGAGAGFAACLFHNPCQWIGFVQQPELALRLVQFTRIEITASPKKDPVHVGHQTAGIAHTVGPPSSDIFYF